MRQNRRKTAYIQRTCAFQRASSVEKRTFSVLVPSSMVYRIQLGPQAVRFNDVRAHSVEFCKESAVCGSIQQSVGTQHRIVPAPFPVARFAALWAYSAGFCQTRSGFGAVAWGLRFTWGRELVFRKAKRIRKARRKGWSLEGSNDAFWAIIDG